MLTDDERKTINHAADVLGPSLRDLATRLRAIAAPRVATVGELLATAPVARPISEWHEDYGNALWWRFPIDEPPYSGSPLDDDWPGYHTHWTPIVCPDDPGQRGPLLAATAPTAAPRPQCPTHGDTVSCYCTTGALHCHDCGHTPPFCTACDGYHDAGPCPLPKGG